MQLLLSNTFLQKLSPERGLDLKNRLDPIGRYRYGYPISSDNLTPNADSTAAGSAEVPCFEFLQDSEAAGQACQSIVTAVRQSQPAAVVIGLAKRFLTSPLESSWVNLVHSLETLANQLDPIPVAIQNGIPVPSSRDLWNLRESVRAPNLAFAWNCATGLQAGEHPSVALPRLASALRIVELSDYSNRQDFSKFPPFTAPESTIPKTIELLRGLGFTGYLVITPPRSPISDDALFNYAVAAGEFVRAAWKRPPVPLSAYKGDKHAPRFSRQSRGAET